MRIEKITQYNQLNNNYMALNPELKSQTSIKNSEVRQYQTPSFNGFFKNLKDLAYRIFDGDDEEQPKPKDPPRRAPFSDERPCDQSRKRYTTDRPIESKYEVIKTPARKTVKEPVPEISPAIIEVEKNKYALIEEYDRLSKARAELRKKTKGRSLTPEEKAESERLRLSWGEVYHRLVPEHQSIVRTKTASDFANETEKQKYIMNYVLPRMEYSEESALDALDMFEQFGFRADYSNGIDTTITRLADGMRVLPKECRSDKVLNRYIEVFGKYADNAIRNHPDDDELAGVIVKFTTTKGQPIHEDTILRGIELMKRIACQKWNHERLNSALVSSYNAKYKNSEPIKKSLDELQEIVKDMKYRLTADDKC